MFIFSMIIAFYSISALLLGGLIFHAQKKQCKLKLVVNR